MDDYAEHPRVYFGLGIKYKDILECLAVINGIVMSMSSIKRQLTRLGLLRRKCYTDLVEVASFILENLSGLAQNHGYKIMHFKCTQNGYGYNVTQETGPRLNIKTVLSRYGDSYVKDKTAVRTSYL